MMFGEAGKAVQEMSILATTTDTASTFVLKFGTSGRDGIPIRVSGRACLGCSVG